MDERSASHGPFTAALSKPMISQPRGDETVGSRPIVTKDKIMSIVTIEEAKGRLAELIDNLMLGEEVIITPNQQPVAQLIPLPFAKPQPVFGSCKGMLTTVAEDGAHLKDFSEHMPSACCSNPIGAVN
jgi:antitoxin (DNA-binding transcriptional repressor) of toxin-antitoxin stability system